MDYDLIAIGSGTAGSAAATKCAEAGWKVAVVDDRPFGGTCALRGCDPKKILRRGAEIVDSARLLQGKGVDPGTLSIEWPALTEYKRGFTAPMSQRIENGLKAAGVDTLHGRASFTGPDRLDVDGTSFTASRLLIGTGAKPRRLDFPGSEHLVDSTAFMELEKLPQRILFVGGGFISFEFAHIAARAGARVTIVTHGRRPLRGFDPDLVDLLIARSAEIGIDIRTDTSVQRIKATGPDYHIDISHDGRTDTLDVDLVVHGAGREPDLVDLSLEAADVAYDAHGSPSPTTCGASATPPSTQPGTSRPRPGCR